MKTSDQDECLLCCREISIYAVGICDHPVCFVCSARMRVLCETNECPICRSDMPMVICTLKKKPFSEISKKFSLIDKKFQISFENPEIQKSFLLLLENKCAQCDDTFHSFNKLRDHVRRVHSFQYCELCAESLKLFPFERKIYDRKDLARHKRIGDPDQTSHRGHPLCEFCDQRYVDSDELFRHLRREHYFCHFCDADGKNQFYEDYSYLKVHFRKDHYLCEEGDCANEQFTGAFRTEIDLKAHIATHHSKNKSKAEARQARMLELEFTYASHNRSNVHSSPRGNRFNHKRQNVEENHFRENRQPAETEKIDTQSTLEFPYLSEDGDSGSAIPKSNLNSMTLQSFSRNAIPQRQKEPVSFDDFPALVSTTVSVTSEGTNNQSREINFSIFRQQNSIAGKGPKVSIHLAQKNVQSRTSESVNEEMNNKKHVPTWISKKSTNFEDEFPKLEPKKNAVTYTNILNTTVNNVQSRQPPTVEIVSSSESGGDQFLYIKSKSRKKKNKTGYEDKTSENVDDADERDIQNCSLINNNFSLFQQDSNAKLKKNLLRPSPKTNFVEDELWQRKVTFGKDDFPPLASSEPVRKPPGFGSKIKKPPPGFNLSSSSCMNPAPAPAPLKISLMSIARQLATPNENKNVDPEIPHSDFMYSHPVDFKKRNEILANKIRILSVFEEFRTKSGEFRRNEITAAEYYSECLNMLGEKDFMDIFPELICLLPDINKQQELFNVHKMHQNNSGAVPKQKLENTKLTVCDICYQVLMEFDHDYHISQHEKEN